MVVVTVIVVAIAIAVVLVVADMLAAEVVALTVAVLVVLIVLKSALVIVSELVVMAVQATVKEHAVAHAEVNVLRIVRATAIFNVQNNVHHSVEMDVNQCAPKDVEQAAVKGALTGVLRCHNFEKTIQFNMKKFLLFLILAIPLFANAQITTFETCANVHGYWTTWQPRNRYYQYIGTSDNEIKYMISYNRYSKVFNGMEFRRSSANEWDWCFKIEVDNYIRPNKKDRKAHMKSNQWYEYSGWVEYYVTDDYPTIEKVLEVYKFPLIEPKGDSARAKRRARATIKIAPYKKEPICFNIYFDGVGVGFSFRSWPFDKAYVVQ